MTKYEKQLAASIRLAKEDPNKLIKRIHAKHERRLKKARAKLWRDAK